MAPSKSQQGDEQARQPAPPSGAPAHRRKWRFRVMAMVFPISLIVIVELLLVAFGAGNDLGLVVRVPGNPELLRFQVNPHAEESYFAGRQLAGPEPKRFELPAPDDIFRVVVVGGSTVLGFPYPPELSFPRQLELLLNLQNLNHKFEVINLGMVAINSFSVADVVEQAVRMSPDLIIVHTGHNEFYGPGGAASTTSMMPLAVKVRRRRLFQLIASMIVDESAHRNDLMEELPASVTLPRGGARFKQAAEQYRNNLEQIVTTASAAKIPLVLTTMASNLRDHSPVSFHVPETLSNGELERWRASFDKGRQLTVEKRWQEAIEYLEQARAISGESSLLHFRMGQCLEALEQYESSRAEFELARDLDGCRFRAPGSFRGIVKDVAARANRPDVFFIDSAERLALEAGPAAPGYNLFLEHVHYNLDGHRRLATILGRFVQEKVLERQWDQVRIPGDSDFDQRLGLLQEDRVSGLSYALKVMTVFPMSETFDVNLHQEAIVGRIKHELDLLDTKKQQVFAELSLDDMAGRMAEALADICRSKDQVTQELYYRRRDQIRRPWDPDVAFRLARCLADVPDHQVEALQLCRRAVDLNPQHRSASNLLKELVARSARKKREAPAATR